MFRKMASIICITTLLVSLVMFPALAENGQEDVRHVVRPQADLAEQKIISQGAAEG